MGKKADNSVIDAALNVIAGSIQEILCEGEPADFTDATTLKGSGGKGLAIVSTDPGDFAIADGDVSGRKVTVAAQTGVPVTGADGTGNHIALVSGSVLLYVTTSPDHAVSNGGTVDIGQWDAELLDPV